MAQCCGYNSFRKITGSSNVEVIFKVTFKPLVLRLSVREGFIALTSAGKIRLLYFTKLQRFEQIAILDRMGLTFFLSYTILASMLGMLQFGYNTGVINAPEVNIENFMKDVYKDRYGEDIQDDSVQLLYSLAVSIFAIGGMLGGFSGGVIANKFGRKGGLLLNNVLGIGGACLMGFTKIMHSYELLFLGRFIIGVNCGAKPLHGYKGQLMTKCLVGIPAVVKWLDPASGFLKHTCCLLLAGNFFPFSCAGAWAGCWTADLLGDGDTKQEFVELLVIPDGQLQVMGNDASLIFFMCHINSQLEHLSSEILHYGGQVYGSSGTHSLDLVARTKQMLDSADGN
ncbi:Solute carrier 2, facilitated glucose transporter member 4 [Homalodisca vitripennis]|nr:Solute carrier 2, facilitated glucose transporter member 4 [Homalodisca vitripennis]